MHGRVFLLPFLMLYALSNSLSAQTATSQLYGVWIVARGEQALTFTPDGAVVMSRYAQDGGVPKKVADGMS